MLQRLGIRRSRRLLAAAARERGGGVLIWFALAIPILVALVLGGIDFNRATLAKSKLQDALDASTLWAARSEATTDPELQSAGDLALGRNFSDRHGAQLISASFSADGPKVLGRAQARVTPTFAQLWPGGGIVVGATSEVVRTSKNLEVAMVLDVTGSMAGARIVALRQAAQDLVDIVVKDVQTPFYSKVAVAPYSVGVNVGPLAEQARGAIRPGLPITRATRDNPVKITARDHGFRDGQKVFITGVGGMTQLNDREFTVDNSSRHAFELSNVDGTRYGTYSSGGNVYCTEAGCEYFGFDNAAWPSARRVYRASTCVSERVGSNAYTDAPTTIARVGLNYPNPNNRCPAAEIIPLTSDRQALNTQIANLQPAGSTAGQIGLAWGWYLVSPRFSAAAPPASRPAPYGRDDVLKVVVLMTDGEFNTAYCNGVIARNAGGGSGSASDKINCNATNGDPFTQAQRLCDNIKAAGVTLYTVGLEMGNDPRARAVLEQCASGPSYARFPAGAGELREAFRAIAQDINGLRISR